MTDDESKPMIDRLLEILDVTFNMKYGMRQMLFRFHLETDTRQEALSLIRAGALEGRAMDVSPCLAHGYYDSLVTMAARSGEAEVLRALVEAGCDPRAGYVNSAPPERQKRAPSPICEAAQVGALDCVRVLLELGVGPNEPAPRSHSGPVAYVTDDHLDVLKLLLESGGDPCIPNHNGLTPLDRASNPAANRPKCYAMMLETMRAIEAADQAEGAPPKPACVLYTSAGPVDLTAERGIRRMIEPEEPLRGLWCFVRAPADAVSDALVEKGVFKRRWAKEVERGGEVHRFGDVSEFGFVLQLRGVEWSVVTLAKQRMRGFSGKVASLGKALGVDAVSVEGSEAFLLRGGKSIAGARWDGDDLGLSAREEDRLSPAEFELWEKKVQAQIEERFEEADTFFAERGIFLPRMMLRQIGQRPELVLFDLQPEDVEALHLIVFKR